MSFQLPNTLCLSDKMHPKEHKQNALLLGIFQKSNLLDGRYAI